MKNVLVISGHTDLNDSVANKIVLEELKKALPQAEFDILSEEYPTFNINVEAEQHKLRKADVIVWQFPVFWYSMPSILHRWIEKVCVHGFAHGSTGTALEGKKLIPSFTTGAPEVYYSHEALGYTIDELIGSQIKSIAGLCKLDLQPSVYTGGVSYALRSDAQQLEEIKKLSKEHAERLLEQIKQA
ncbi:NAD(P)H-dependent oxidoreductase [Prevotella sp. A2931]|uniref:NAD(P)H-dependent oxidoreductase n=1 Tax=Prevotella illustrans TaxID=2800387 RepID=A0ABS3M2M4_9BACT|nr:MULTISPECIES: NAD(P)H-dependent oxidoreductase [Prevotella]MBO1362418.1 NAD(P)H-dependent oxidoreductase [Prevotella illustrans]PTL25069.1 NAD(P)H dehydrogenase [Prevotella sp. oral taxon 820]